MKTKILYLTPLSPFELTSGGSVRSRLLLNALSKCGVVYTTCLTSSNPASSNDLSQQNQEFVKFVPEWKCTPDSFAQKCWCAVKGLLGCQNFCHYPNSEEICQRLGWPGLKFDLVVTRFCETAMSVGAWKIAPLLIDIDDLPIEDYNAFNRPTLSWLKGGIVGVFVRLWQILAFRKSSGTWLPNQTLLSDVLPYAKCTYLPNVVSSISRDYDKNLSIQRRLVTVASLNYIPNAQGISWFLGNVWDRVRSKYPGLEYWIVGKHCDATLAREWLSKPGVVMTGYVEDLHSVYGEALAVVAPVLIGGGTAVKTIEAIAHGKKVFATPFATRGMTQEQKSHAHLSEFQDAETFLRTFDEFCRLPEDAKVSARAEMFSLTENDYSESFFNRQVKKLIGEVLFKS